MATRINFGTVVRYHGTWTAMHGEWVVTSIEAVGRWNLADPTGARHTLVGARESSFTVLPNRTRKARCESCGTWHTLGRRCTNDKCSARSHPSNAATWPGPETETDMPKILIPEDAQRRALDAIDDLMARTRELERAIFATDLSDPASVPSPGPLLLVTERLSLTLDSLRAAVTAADTDAHRSAPTA